MCYSALVQSGYDKYVRLWAADISLQQFYHLYFLRDRTAGIKIPKAIDAGFARPRNDDERQIKALIVAYNASHAARLQPAPFTQRKPRTDADHTQQS